MYNLIEKYCLGLISEFDQIPEGRKYILETISKYINEKLINNVTTNLIYICTHNSRRSHFGQIWARVAANYYNVKDVNSYSGGTEATAFHVNAIGALKRIGFEVEETKPGTNPHYQVVFSGDAEPIECFSKVYNDPTNPQHGFAAIMTCGDAEENCPFIPGVELRMATTYEDPKAFDQTVWCNEKYDERCRQIAREVFYVFSKVKQV